MEFKRTAARRYRPVFNGPVVTVPVTLTGACRMALTIVTFDMENDALRRVWERRSRGFYTMPEAELRATMHIADLCRETRMVISDAADGETVDIPARIASELETRGGSGSLRRLEETVMVVARPANGAEAEVTADAG